MQKPLLLGLLVALPFSLVVACSGGEVPTDDNDGTTASAGGSDSTTSSSGSTSTATSSGSTSSSSSGQGGMGTGGGAGWPTCETQPAGSDQKTIGELWTDDPATPTPVWLPGVYVTAVAGSGCVAGQACQIFVQQEESFASFAAAAQQAIRIGIAPAAAEHFTGIAVGDRVDAYGFAFRDTAEGANELMILVTPALEGCANVIGVGTPVPVSATLDQLTVDAYEVTHGPVLVKIDAVTGNPNPPDKTFALWNTGMAPSGDISTVTSLSPFFLSGAAFVGLTDGVNTDFVSVTGVFGLFTPPADPLIKYEEIYVREGADYPLN